MNFQAVTGAPAKLATDILRCHVAARQMHPILRRSPSTSKQKKALRNVSVLTQTALVAVGMCCPYSTAVTEVFPSITTGPKDIEASEAIQLVVRPGSGQLLHRRQIRQSHQGKDPCSLLFFK